ncbi:rhomboid family intramembrane serine protease [Pseudaestuariivita sp.]|uniref:rhomboid family intramembrane serine protease n=1 Tax=Pseudaestuariivita sp. TaxID=2211669 RepID=UPI004059C1D0
MSDTPDPHHTPPIAPVNPIPPVVLALFAAVLGVEMIFTLGAAGYVGGPEAIGWRLGALREYAFFGPVFDWMVEQSRFPREHLQQFVTYPFVHGSFTHALIGGVMMLALGKMAGDAYGNLAAFVLFFASCIGGALAYALITDSEVPLYGVYPAVYGYVGAYTFVLWVKLGQSGQPQVRAFALIGFLLGIQLLFGLLYGAGPTWIADLFGFVTGLALAPLLAPGGVQRMLSKLRRE